MFRNLDGGMGRLALDLPAALGRDVNGDDGAYGRREVDRATETFVRWFDCWAGR